MEEYIKTLASMIKESNNIVFFGGAGVSTESGVKDYRSKDGLYNSVKEYKVSPEEILSHDFFYSNEKIFYDFIKNYFMDKVSPNKAHYALSKLESMGKLKAVITQNIDGLHQIAGSKTVYELHGTISDYYCGTCKRNLGDLRDIIKKGEIPKCKYCGHTAKPKVVLYGEMLDDDVVRNAIDAISKSDMLIVGGTSLVVYPASSFIDYFTGKYTVIINKDETRYDSRGSLVIRDSIGEVLSKAVELL